MAFSIRLYDIYVPPSEEKGSLKDTHESKAELSQKSLRAGLDVKAGQAKAALRWFNEPAPRLPVCVCFEGGVEFMIQGGFKLVTSGSDVEGTQFKLVPFPADSLDHFVAKLGQSSRQILQVDLKEIDDRLNFGVVALLSLSGCDPFAQEELAKCNTKKQMAVGSAAKLGGGAVQSVGTGGDSKASCPEKLQWYTFKDILGATTFIAKADAGAGAGAEAAEAAAAAEAPAAKAAAVEQQHGNCNGTAAHGSSGLNGAAGHSRAAPPLQPGEHEKAAARLYDWMWANLRAREAVLEEAATAAAV